MVLLLDNEVSAATVTPRAAVDALDDIFRELARGEAVDRNKTSLYVPHDDDGLWYRYASMEGASRSCSMAAVRIKTDMVRHLETEMGRREEKFTAAPGTYGGLILLFSADDGRLLAILNDGYLQHVRVGATYGVGVKYLARSDAQTVGVVGSGGMARACLDAFCAVRKIRTVKVFSPTPGHAEQYAEEMARVHSLDVQVVGDAATAADGVDILATTTDAREPILLPDMVRPGRLVAVVSENAEVHPDAYGAFDAIVTERTDMSAHLTTAPDRDDAPYGGTGEHTRQRHQAVEADRVVALHDVMAGRAPGRLHDREAIFFASEGMGTQFVAVARLAYLAARHRGLGRELPDDWFLQDIRT